MNSQNRSEQGLHLGWAYSFDGPLRPARGDMTTPWRRHDVLGMCGDDDVVAVYLPVVIIALLVLNNIPAGTAYLEFNSPTMFLEELRNRGAE